MSDSAIKYITSLYESIDIPIQLIDRTGKVIYINKAFSERWGYKLTELKEYSLLDDPILKRLGVQSTIQKVFKEKDKRIINNFSDTLLRNKEITAPIFRTTIFYIALGSGDFVALMHEDQTDNILAEEEVKKARDGNREAERLKNTFLNVLSHELRTPLNIILGYSSIIKENLRDKLNSEDKIYLDNLHSGTERLFQSITQMLEFAQIEAGNYDIKMETVDLVTIIQACIENIRKIVVDRKIEIKTNFKEKSVFVDADVHSLENAFNNLLRNAVKFTKQGFIEIELDVLESKDLAITRIKDTGVGISTNYMDHLFRPFSQEDLKIGRNYEGNGLGLALAKRYIEKNEGSLLVDSIKGVGSTFTFTLPLSKNYQPETQSQGAEYKNGMKKILMLDDLSESFELITAYLKNDYDVEVHNYKKFNIDSISEHNFDVLIFDVNQNYWDEGLELCRTIKDNDIYKRPVIIISTEYDEAKIDNFYKIGADKFLSKPFSKLELTNALSEVAC